MNRRTFLHAAAAGAVGLVIGDALDLDKLLWVPGAKTYFLPTPAPEADVVAFDLAAHIAKGDVITLEGYFAHDPLTFAPLPHLQQFLVTAVTSSDPEIARVFPTPAVMRAHASEHGRSMPRGKLRGSRLGNWQ